MKVLLCLLSDQHVPNLLSVHHFQPDRLVLVESSVMKARSAADNLLTALKLGGLQYDDWCDIEPLESEDSLDSVRTALRRAYGRHPSDEWIVNLTGGTKPMSIAAYEFFRALTGRLVYMNIARPADVSDIETRRTERAEHRLTIKEFLAGYGFTSVKSDDKVRDAERRAADWWECSRVIAEHGTQDELLRLTTAEERKRARDKGLVLATGELCPSSPPPVRDAICLAFGLPSEGGKPAGKLDKYMAQFLTGGWLETFFWGLLRKHADAVGVWDVRLGIEVARRGAESGNDFDVSFICDHGLCMMECKSGAQEHDPGLDVLYKVEAVTRQFRALHVRSWLATASDLIREKTGNIKPHIANRAALYNCQLVTRDQIQALGAGADKADCLKSIFSPKGA